MKVSFSEHAVARCVERVKPWLDPADAEFELYTLARLGSVHAERPAGVPETSEGGDSWLVISDGIVVPLKRNTATTVLVRAVLPAEMREGRNKARKKARRKRRDRETSRQPRIARRHLKGAEEWQ